MPVVVLGWGRERGWKKGVGVGGVVFRQCNLERRIGAVCGMGYDSIQRCVSLVPMRPPFVCAYGVCPPSHP